MADGKDGSNNKDKGSKPRQGYRKDGTPYKEGNTRADGSFAVGKNRTPEHARFAVGDGRKRGRRKKGVKNADTEFMAEYNSPVPVNENGKKAMVTKGRAADKILFENAIQRRQNKAIAMIHERHDRIAEKAAEAAQYHTLNDYEILATFLRERSDELGIDPNLFGDPEPECDDGDSND